MIKIPEQIITLTQNFEKIPKVIYRVSNKKYLFKEKVVVWTGKRMKHTCAIVNCDKLPKFATSTDSIPFFCKRCSTDDMVEISNRKTKSQNIKIRQISNKSDFYFDENVQSIIISFLEITKESDSLILVSKFWKKILEKKHVSMFEKVTFHKLGEKYKRKIRVKSSYHFYHIQKKICPFCNSSFRGCVDKFWGVYGHNSCIRDETTNLYYVDEDTVDAIRSPDFDVPIETRIGYSRYRGYSDYLCAWKSYNRVFPQKATLQYVSNHPIVVEKRRIRKEEIDKINEERRLEVIEAEKNRKEKRKIRQNWMNKLLPEITELCDKAGVSIYKLDKYLYASDKFPTLTNIKKKTYSVTFIDEVNASIKQLEEELEEEKREEERKRRKLYMDEMKRKRIKEISMMMKEDLRLLEAEKIEKRRLLELTMMTKEDPLPIIIVNGFCISCKGNKFKRKCLFKKCKKCCNCAAHA